MLDITAFEKSIKPLTDKYDTTTVFNDLIQAVIYVYCAPSEEDFLLIGAFDFLKSKYPYDDICDLFLPPMYIIKRLVWMNRNSPFGNDIMGEYYSRHIASGGIKRNSIDIKSLSIDSDFHAKLTENTQYTIDTSCATGIALIEQGKKYVGQYQRFFGIEQNLLFAQISAINLLCNGESGEILYVKDNKFILSYDIEGSQIYQNDENEDNSIVWQIYNTQLSFTKIKHHHIMYLKPQ